MKTPITWIDAGPFGAGFWIRSSDGRSIAVAYGPTENLHAKRDRTILTAAPILVEALKHIVKIEPRLKDDPMVTYALSKLEA